MRASLEPRINYHHFCEVQDFLAGGVGLDSSRYSHHFLPSSARDDPAALLAPSRFVRHLTSLRSPARRNYITSASPKNGWLARLKGRHLRCRRRRLRLRRQCRRHRLRRWFGDGVEASASVANRFIGRFNVPGPFPRPRGAEPPSQCTLLQFRRGLDYTQAWQAVLATLDATDKALHEHS